MERFVQTSDMETEHDAYTSGWELFYDIVFHADPTKQENIHNIVFKQSKRDMTHNIFV